MIVTVEKHFGNWAVSIVQGHQGFHLNSIEGTPKAEAEWMAKMFRKALKTTTRSCLRNTCRCVGRTFRKIRRDDRAKKNSPSILTRREVLGLFLFVHAFCFTCLKILLKF